MTKTKLLKIRITAAFISFLMRLVYLSSRKTYGNYETVRQHIDTHGSVIFVVWHGSFFPFVHFAHKHCRNIDVLTSLSADGELLSQIIKSFGGDVARGDEKNHGVEGLVTMIRLYRKGRNLVFAADGPLGPRHTLKPGVIACAQKTGGPIIPMGCSASRALVFSKAWDRFFFPFPFCRMHIEFGAPLFVPRDCSREEYAGIGQTLEQRLAALTIQADTEAGASFRQVSR